MDAQGPEREVIDGPDRKGRQEVPEESADLLLAPIDPVLGQESRIVVIVTHDRVDSFLFDKCLQVVPDDDLRGGCLDVHGGSPQKCMVGSAQGEPGGYGLASRMMLSGV